MEPFNVGDTVAFTSATLLAIAAQKPELFEILKTNGRYGGAVKSCNGNTIVVDLGEAAGEYQFLTIECDMRYPGRTLQLVKRAGEDGLLDEQQPPRCVATLTLNADGSVETDSSHCPTQIPPISMSVPKMMIPREMGPFAAMGQAMQSIASRPVVPLRIQMAQWVMVQFVALKQYTIAQDVERGGPPTDEEDDGEAWKRAGREEKRVRLHLSDPEQDLYHTALARLRGWLEQSDDPPPPPPPVIPQPPVPAVTMTPAPPAPPAFEQAEPGNS